MEKDKIFFAESGLTTTSANHVANLAKEAVQTIMTSLEGIKFYTTKIGLLGSNDEKVISSGTTLLELEKFQPTLMEISQYKSLIAWLREAIKAKDRLIKEATDLSSKDIAEVLGLELPKVPEMGDIPGAEDVIASWNIKQRNRYYYLETVCSTVGQFIHPNGKFSNEREELKEKINNPNKLLGGGRDTIIYSYAPTVSQADVDDEFFKLQKLYREFQAELNSMKHSIEVAIQEASRKVHAKYQNECDEYKAVLTAINAKIVAYREEQVKLAQNLKITIPDSLKEIFQKVNGK